MVETPNPASVLYHVAEDFVKLSYVQKFNIGLELNVLFAQDVDLYDEFALEEVIFSAMYRRHKLSEFVVLVYKVRYA